MTTVRLVDFSGYLRGCGRAGGAHAVPGIERGDLVGFGEGRVVEGVLDEVFEGSLQVDHRLTYVDQLGRALADDVGAEQAAGLEREDQLHHARVQAHDVAARGFAETG